MESMSNESYKGCVKIIKYLLLYLWRLINKNCTESGKTLSPSYVLASHAMRIRITFCPYGKL